MSKELPDIRSFLKHLEQLFDESTSDSFAPETLFRNLPSWTSLQSLVVLINFDEEYGVSISADELQKAQTLADLYLLVKDKQGI
jgi:acyl carrier protein